MDKGKIIILNGVSSSGKTTLAQALQNKLPEPYMFLSIDGILRMMPERSRDDIDGTIRHCQSVLHRMIRLLSDMGMNVIVDNIMLAYFDTLQECIDVLHAYPVLLVHVACPAHELRRREQARGDRNVGNGESQLKELQPQEQYDLTVDTYAKNIEECVKDICNMVATPQSWHVVNELCQR